MTAYEPRLGDTVKDVDTGKVGRVIGFVGPYVQLRPGGGGVEWDARPESLRPAALTQALSAGVAQVNAQSRTGTAVKANALVPARPQPQHAPAPEPVDLSAECTVAQHPDYVRLHTHCRQTEDVPLPHAIGLMLIRRCGCSCHLRAEEETS